MLLGVYKMLFVFFFFSGEHSPDISPTIDGQLVDGVFVYSDGSQVTYFNWNNGNPAVGNNCIKLIKSNNFKFSSTECSNLKYFMCQIRLN